LSLLEERIKRSKRTASKKVDPAVVPQFAPKEQEVIGVEGESGDNNEPYRNEEEEEDALPPVV
jgi:hypothetical protein